MPHPPKILRNNDVVLVSTRVEEGLPFVATDYMSLILFDILARAQNLYPVTICHFIFSQNHLHLLLMVENPENLPLFMKYLKQESAHAVNHFLGRRKRTVWASGYDSPILLTYDKVLYYITYIYSNPQDANLVDKIKDYPGFSSWNMFVQDKTKHITKRINRTSIPRLIKKRMSLREQEDLAMHLEKQSIESLESSLILSPYAWTKCFPETFEWSLEETKKTILERVQEEESRLRTRRASEGKKILGAIALRLQEFNKPYTPQKHGKRMTCISSDIPLRKRFLSSVKELLCEAKKVLNLWRSGDRSVPWPPGLFAPCMPRVANVIPGCLLA